MCSLGGCAPGTRERGLGTGGLNVVLLPRKAAGFPTDADELRLGRIWMRENNLGLELGRLLEGEPYRVLETACGEDLDAICESWVAGSFDAMLLRMAGKESAGSCGRE